MRQLDENAHWWVPSSREDASGASHRIAARPRPSQGLVPGAGPCSPCAGRASWGRRRRVGSTSRLPSGRASPPRAAYVLDPGEWGRSMAAGLWTHVPGCIVRLRACALAEGMRGGQHVNERPTGLLGAVLAGLRMALRTGLLRLLLLLLVLLAPTRPTLRPGGPPLSARLRHRLRAFGRRLRALGNGRAVLFPVA